MSMPYHLAVASLELGEWLTGQGRSPEAETLVAEARHAFGQLRALPWLERASASPDRPPTFSPI